MKKYRACVRTVRNNQVRVYGRTLCTSDLNGELEGMRCLFIPYRGEFENTGLCALWGTEKAYRASLHDDWDPDSEAGSEAGEVAWQEQCALLAPNGVFMWYFWRDVMQAGSDDGQGEG